MKGTTLRTALQKKAIAPSPAGISSEASRALETVLASLDDFQEFRRTSIYPSDNQADRASGDYMRGSRRARIASSCRGSCDHLNQGDQGGPVSDTHRALEGLSIRPPMGLLIDSATVILHVFRPRSREFNTTSRRHVADARPRRRDFASDRTWLRARRPHAVAMEGVDICRGPDIESGPEKGRTGPF